MSTAKSNCWLIRRDFNGSTIIVSAQYIPALETWGMTCKANGTLVDHRQADEPFTTALTMIEIATVNLDAGVDHGGKENPTADEDARNDRPPIT